MTKIKKKFTSENPALTYISTADENIDSENSINNHINKSPIQQDEQSLQTNHNTLNPPNGYKIDHRFVETKSRRVNLLLQPSLVQEAQLLAKSQKTSLNELFTIALRYYILNFKSE